MRYDNIYRSLIERAKHRILTGYSERHHIVPKCRGGSDDLENLVNLTAAEHYLAHLLLHKMHPEDFGLIKAVSMMTVSSSTTIRNNKQYEWFRIAHSKACKRHYKGIGNTQYGSKWVTNGNINKKISKDDEVPEGFRFGRFIPEKTKIETRCYRCEALTGSVRRKTCTSCNIEIRAENGRKNHNNSVKAYREKVFITNGLQDKLISRTLEIPKGWRKGRSNNRPKKNPPTVKNNS